MNSNTRAIAVSNVATVVVSARQEAVSARDALLSLTRKGTCIADAASAERCAALLRDVATFIMTIEGQRQNAKAPILVIGKRIDATAAELTEELKAEKTRLGNILAGWQVEQNRLIEEARIKAEEEAGRLRWEAEQKERAERERLEAEARAAREKAEAEARALEEKAAKLKSEKAKEKALAEAQARREAAEANIAQATATAEAQAVQRIDAVSVEMSKVTGAIMAGAPQKQAGIATKRDVEFEVKDVRALHAAHPLLVKLEPINSAIKSALKNLPEGESLPGVSHRWVVGSVVRG